MQTIDRSAIQVEAWVKGTSLDDERIRGYVESLSPDGVTAKVRVVESDNSLAVGRAIISRVNRLEALPTEVHHDRASLAQLIDVALDAGDRDWFAELAALLAEAGMPSDAQVGGVKLTYSPINRIRA